MTTTRKPTLADVARHAGVAPSTASYVLNGQAPQMRISVSAQERVRQAVTTLGYRPNRSARNLRTRRTKTIGLISDYLATGEFASQMLAGASATAHELDHLVLIGETEGDKEQEQRLIEEMLDRQVDGMIYATLAASRIELPASLRGQKTVLLNCYDPCGCVPSVLPAEWQGGRTAVELLLETNRANAVAVVGLDPNPVAIAGPRRFAGIVERLEEAGLEITEHVDCNWRVDEAFDAVSSLLTTGTRPSAFICLNDRIAMGTYQALAAHAITVPNDVSVISFDGSSLAGWLRPTLASVALPFAAMGGTAVRLLMDPNTTNDLVVEVPMTVSPGQSL